MNTRGGGGGAIVPATVVAPSGAESSVYGGAQISCSLASQAWYRPWAESTEWSNNNRTTNNTASPPPHYVLGIYLDIDNMLLYSDPENRQRIGSRMAAFHLSVLDQYYSVFVRKNVVDFLQWCRQIATYVAVVSCSARPYAEAVVERLFAEAGYEPDFFFTKENLVRSATTDNPNQPPLKSIVYCAKQNPILHKYVMSPNSCAIIFDDQPESWIPTDRRHILRIPNLYEQILQIGTDETTLFLLTTTIMTSLRAQLGQHAILEPRHLDVALNEAQSAMPFTS